MRALLRAHEQFFSDLKAHNDVNALVTGVRLSSLAPAAGVVISSHIRFLFVHRYMQSMGVFQLLQCSFSTNRAALRHNVFPRDHFASAAF